MCTIYNITPNQKKIILKIVQKNARKIFFLMPLDGCICTRLISKDAWMPTASF
jgi:hypothetical protein